MVITQAGGTNVLSFMKTTGLSNPFQIDASYSVSPVVIGRITWLESDNTHS